MAEFARRVEQQHRVTLPDYAALHRWSVERLDDFWSAVWTFFDVGSRRPTAPALASTAMPGATWFPQEELNYVAHAFQQRDDDRTAIIDASEPGPIPPKSDLSWRELKRQVASLAHTLSSNGIGRGDRVVGYLPNIPETVVAFLATASLGAVWAGCGQDYAVAAAHARFEQLEPAALITADGYYFNGKCRDNTANAANLLELLPSVRLAIAVSRVGIGVKGMLDWAEAITGNDELVPLPVPFDHPLWVVFSSGTTGRPKGIVHGHGGVLLEHLKFGGLHLNLGEMTPSSGSPRRAGWCGTFRRRFAGRRDHRLLRRQPVLQAAGCLWDVAARQKVTVLGTSPGYLLGCLKADADPKSTYDRRRCARSGHRIVAPPGASLWLSEHLGDQSGSARSAAAPMSSPASWVAHRRCRCGPANSPRVASA